jgi:predicted unusual protein kinase regulating ubiquinone biosynthesis (AarF/ABC1/UbiB family)
VDQGFLPDEFSEVMTKAQYSVPPINRSLVRSIIRRELGGYPEQVFSSFDTEAMAAASIGQVHKAVLKDGRKAAVKIQYPGVRDTISSDIALARTLFKRLVSDRSMIDEYVDEIRLTLLEETDYIKEGESIDRFHHRFANNEVITPEWVSEFSTERVLTMTFIEGVHLDEFLKTDPQQEKKNHYGQLLWNFFHRQVEDHEEIHADTHPGNFLFTPDGKLGVIDFGCVKSFPEEFFMDYLRLLPTHLQRDEPEIKKLYKRLDVLQADPETSEKENRFYQFCINYGYAFAMPYLNDSFDFGNPEYRDMIRQYTKNAPLSNEPRGSKHFIYSTRVHLGLYHFLMRLGAEVSTAESKRIVDDVLSANAPA